MATTVTIGGADATDVTVTSATELTAVVPAGTAGPADVTVTTSAGSDTLTDGYTYVDAPTITSIDPTSGPEAGGTTVTITGTGFIDGDTGVLFGEFAAEDITVVSDTELTVVSPAASGTVDITVSTGASGGSDTLPDAFTYVPALTVTAVDPTTGPAAGGNTITITGTGFEV